MKISEKLNIISLFSLSIVLLMVASLFYASHRSNSLAKDYNIALELVTGVSELEILTSDYLLFHEQRAQEQWRSKHTSLTTLIRESSFTTDKERDLVAKIAASLDKEAYIFKKLVTRIERLQYQAKQKGESSDVIERLRSWLLLESREMSTNSFQLAHYTHAQQKRVEQQEHLLIIILSTTLVAGIILISWTIRKSFVIPVAKLQQGTSIIAQGRLDHRLKTSGHDELASLAQSLNAMAANLKKTLASRDELMAEIAKRTQVMKRTEGINTLKGELLTPHPLEKRLDITCDHVVRIFNADFCRIWLVRPGDLCRQGCQYAIPQGEAEFCQHREKCLHLVSSAGRYTHVDGGHQRVPFGWYKVGRIAAGAEGKFISTDVTKEPWVRHKQWAKELGLVSFAGYRLLSKVGMPLGVLALFSKELISSDDDILLEGVANTTAQIIQLATAESEVESLKGILPFCSFCKKIRDDKGYWEQVDVYIHKYSKADISHSICPDCMKKHYPEVHKELESRKG